MTSEQQAIIRESVARAMHPDDWERLSRNNRYNALLTASASIAAHLKALEAAGYRVHRPHDWDGDFNYQFAWQKPNEPKCRRCGMKRPFLGDAGDCEVAP